MVKADQIKYEKGSFLINGKKEFLYGAEVHYFRIPQEEWRDRLEKVKEAGCNLVSTYIPWIWHESVEGEVDVTGQTHPEKDVDGFLSLCEEMGFYTIVRPGPYVMAELVHAGIPRWLIDQYPEIVARTKEGNMHPVKVVSYLHPTFLEKVSNWFAKIMPILNKHQITSGGSVIMLQLCNEVGMLHWVTNSSDFSQVTWGAFQRYLEENYQQVENLNQTYETDYSSFQEVSISPVAEKGLIFQKDWGEFWRWYIKDYFQELIHMVSEYGIQVPYLVNVHGFKDFSVYSRGTDYPIGLSQLYRTGEIPNVVLAGDFYPGHVGYDTYHDLIMASEFTKCIQNEDVPLFSAEFQSGRLSDAPRVYPQDLDLNTRTCVAHGMNALNYYMFAGGVNRENIGEFGAYHEWQAPLASDGTRRPIFYAAQRLGKLYQTFGKFLVETEKEVVTHVGFNPNYYMTETDQANGDSLIRRMVREREDYGFNGLMRLLSCANLHFKAHDLLKEDVERLVESTTLWVFSQEMMDGEIQRKLAEYVKQGGRLVLYPRIPTKGLDGQEDTTLKDALGIIVEKELMGRYQADWGGYECFAVMNPTIFGIDEESTALANLSLDHDRIVAFKKKVGQGEILVMGFGFQHTYNYQISMIKQIASEELGIIPKIWSDTEYVSIVPRLKEGYGFISVLNYDEFAVNFTLFSKEGEMWNGDSICLAPRSGMLLPVNLPLDDEMMIDYATVEIIGIKKTETSIHLEIAGTTSSLGVIQLSNVKGMKVVGEAIIQARENGSTLRIALNAEKESRWITLKKQ